MYNQLQLREIFHLEFLRWFSRKVKSSFYAVKGGVNLRFFFGSSRYSEDMDIDARNIGKDKLEIIVMQILESHSFINVIRPFGIERVVPPNLAAAKQTETTQRFKTHLISSAGEDLFTKIEFSRRRDKGRIVTGPVPDNITRIYKMPPLLVSHYDIDSAVRQKIEALGRRAVTQARDIFDLYVLSSQYVRGDTEAGAISPAKIRMAHERIFSISFEEFRDSVVSYLSAEEQNTYNRPEIWDEIRLKADSFMEELGGGI